MQTILIHDQDLVAALGVTPRFYPKKDTTLRQRGSAAWREMFEVLVLDPQQWPRQTHEAKLTQCL